MGFFNEKLAEALFSGNYVCSKCGSPMVFEDEWKETLVCENCGHDVDLDLYGSEDEEDYSALYPTQEEVESSED